MQPMHVNYPEMGRKLKPALNQDPQSRHCSITPNLFRNLELLGPSLLPEPDPTILDFPVKIGCWCWSFRFSELFNLAIHTYFSIAKGSFPSSDAHGSSSSLDCLPSSHQVCHRKYPPVKAQQAKSKKQTKKTTVNRQTNADGQSQGLKLARHTRLGNLPVRSLYMTLAKIQIAKRISRKQKHANQ